MIIYRRSDDRSLLSFGAPERFLAEQLNQNTPWDKLVQSFLNATGNISEHGETALFAQVADPSNVAAEVSRIFMGVQISSPQCHDHPTDRWKRQQFHEFAAFFPACRSGQSTPTGRSADSKSSRSIPGRGFAVPVNR